MRNLKEQYNPSKKLKHQKEEKFTVFLKSQKSILNNKKVYPKIRQSLLIRKKVWINKRYIEI